MYPAIQQDSSSNTKEVHIVSVSVFDDLINKNIKRKGVTEKWKVIKNKTRKYCKLLHNSR